MCIDCSINPRAAFACKKLKRSRNLHTFFGVVVYWKIYPLLIVVVVYIKYLHLLRTHFQIFMTIFRWQMIWPCTDTGKQIFYDKCPWRYVGNAFCTAEHEASEVGKAEKLLQMRKFLQKKIKIIKTFLKQRTDVGWTFMPLISVDRTIMLYLLFSCFPCRTEHFAVYKGLVCILWVLVFQII